MKIPECLDAKGRPLPEHRCPVCGYEMDAATGVLDLSRPLPGDLSICLNCAEVLEFTPDMQVKRATLKKLMAAPADVRELIGRVQAVVRRVSRKLKP